MTGGGDMSERDPAIRLFGRKISLPECQIPASSSHIPSDSAPADAKPEVEKPCADNSEQLENSSDLKDSSKVCEHTEEKNEPKVNPKPLEDKMETSSTNEDKMFKKPDKIQQCPRCNSLDTKFCYFNNYNVNQPRHFCKNCQRYWTAGGTMRNVPVGAGRRRNKHLSSQYRHIMVASDGIQTTKLETRDSSGHQLVSTLESSAAFRSSTDDGTILKFGPDAPLYDSVDSILNIRDQKRSFDKPCINCVENGEEPSLCGSSVTNASGAQGNEVSELTMQRDPSVSNEHSTSNRLHCCPVPPWVFPCNPGWNNVASMAAANHNQSSTPVQWYPPPAVTVPGICPPNIPLQFVAAPYWSGTVWAAGTGTVSIGSNGCLSPSSSTSNSCCSGNGSPSLGKHSREEKSEKCVLVPKTLRIDDPNEASRIPIWATLGINPAKRESVSEVSILRKLEAKEEGKDRAMGVSRILEAIPAAISGAHAVHEST